MADEVLYEARGDRIAVVTLNRPRVRNAVNGALATALEAVVERVERDDEIWAAVLTSSNPHSFCAGADLSELAAGIGAMNTERGGFAGFVDAPRRKPWIAAVRGSALGGGLELALACDMIVVGESTRLGLPEVKRGLIAGAGGVYRLPRAIPRHIGLELVATGEAISAARAADLGLVNRVASDTEVLDVALDLARMINANSPLAVRESLAVARLHADHADAELRRRTMEGYDRLQTSADFAEGPRAFLEKRPPRWTGR